jgi:hypothetical protein
MSFLPDFFDFSLLLEEKKLTQGTSRGLTRLQQVIREEQSELEEENGCAIYAAGIPVVLLHSESNGDPEERFHKEYPRPRRIYSFLW